MNEARGASCLRRAAVVREHEAPMPSTRTPRSFAARAAGDSGVCDAYRAMYEAMDAMTAVVLVESAAIYRASQRCQPRCLDKVSVDIAFPQSNAQMEPVGARPE